MRTIMSPTSDDFVMHFEYHSRFSLGVLRPSLVRFLRGIISPRWSLNLIGSKAPTAPAKLIYLLHWQHKRSWAEEPNLSCPCGNKRRSWLDSWFCKLRFNKGREKRLFSVTVGASQSRRKTSGRFDRTTSFQAWHPSWRWTSWCYMYMCIQERQSGLYGEEECNQTAANCF